MLVAGPGIEPGSGGYEPPEVPLLYPAIYVGKRVTHDCAFVELVLTGGIEPPTLGL